MRLVIAILAASIFLPGCKSSDKGGKDKALPSEPARKTDKADRRGSKTDPDKSAITPINVISGRVVLVNQALRYVVVDFGVGRLPALEQTLDVYREGNKVGEVRISSQSKAGNVAADIMAGEAKDGDEVRSQ